MIYGKTLVVTGVASGIGRRTAELAAAMGADVIGVDVNAPAVAAGHFVKADLSSPDGVSALIEALPDGIDALCNVAGLSGTPGAIPTLAVNLYGLRALSENLAPKLRERGAVVNVASIAGFGWRANLDRAKALISPPGFPDVAAMVAEQGIKDEECYPVSKEALLLWTLRASHDQRFKTRHIRVNAVSPGPVETPILKQFRSVLGDERVNSDISRVGRAGTPEDIAPAVLFLCSDAAKWINGANLPADGGLEASVLAEVMNF